jgi:hypothetical protein
MLATISMVHRRPRPGGHDAGRADLRRDASGDAVSRTAADMTTGVSGDMEPALTERFAWPGDGSRHDDRRRRPRGRAQSSRGRSAMQVS